MKIVWTDEIYFFIYSIVYHYMTTYILYTRKRNSNVPPSAGQFYRASCQSNLVLILALTL
jgi:hypothetical protein